VFICLFLHVRCSTVGFRVMLLFHMLVQVGVMLLVVIMDVVGAGQGDVVILHVGAALWVRVMLLAGW